MKPFSHWVFVPSGWTFALYAGLAAAAAWWVETAYPAVPWMDSLGLVLGGVAALAAVGWVFATLLWLLSHRQAGIFQLIYLMLLGCGLLGALITAREIQYEHDEVVAKKIEDSRRALRRREIREAKEALEYARERQARLAEDPFVQYEGVVPDPTLEAMRAVDQEIRTALDEALSAYHKVLTEHELAGPEKWLRLGTREELETERGQHATVYEAARNLYQHLESLEDRYAEKLEALALEPPADRYALAEMERLVQAWRDTGLLRLRQIDIELSGTALQALDLLLENWEAWRYEKTQSRIVFDNSSTELSFMQLLDEAATLSQEQLELQVRLRRIEAEASRE